MNISELITFNRQQLITLWVKLFNNPIPKSIQESLLREIIGWHLQAKEHGGLSAIERRQLKLKAASATGQLAIGSQLIRVWKDETHQVTILEDGYLYNKQKWKSLSAIAKVITGTPWSGPVFFGIKK